MRATGSTDYLKSEGTLEHAQTRAAHSSPRTTKLYDRRNDETALRIGKQRKQLSLKTGK